MDIDVNLFLNFVPIISVSVLIFVMCMTIFFKLRNRWPVKVNCWFCNVDSMVPRQTIDWWMCSHCHQYNGFSQDGDYKYEIPEQHEVAHDDNIINESYCERKKISGNQNRLCSKCIKMEELKLMKLRKLEDSMDGLNHKQIAKFEQSFEKKYPLCLKCQSIVQTVLYKQKIWLMQYKMLLLRQKPISNMIKNREKIEKIFCILLSILASGTIYCAEAWYLPLCGLLFQFVACLARPQNRRKSDILPIFGWICLICVKMLSTTAILKMLQINLDTHWSAVDDVTYRYFILTLATSIGLANLKSQYHKNVSNKSLALKKLQSAERKMPAPQPLSANPEKSQIQKTIDTKKSSRNLFSPVNITNSLMTPGSVEMPIPLKPLESINPSKWSLNKTSSFETYSKKTSPYVFGIENSFPKNFKKEIYNVNDSLTNLNSLSLGSREKRTTILGNQNHKIFETRIYGTSSPDLFKRNPYSMQQKRSILAPARLRSPSAMVDASWVAGGYWHTPNNSYLDASPNLSRSSSQSSGIGSCAGSMYGQSREPSLQELDQCSVMSSAEQQCCFPRPMDSSLSVTSRSISGACRCRSCSSMSQPIPKNAISETSLQQCYTKHDLQCSGHTTTIIMNPVWLPAVLCGSLALNMIVICTTLLR